jgi:hypothetical protein
MFVNVHHAASPIGLADGRAFLSKLSPALHSSYFASPWNA